MADATLMAEKVHARIWSIFPCDGDRDGAVLVLFPPRPLDFSWSCTVCACAMPNEKGGIAVPTRERRQIFRRIARFGGMGEFEGYVMESFLLRSRNMVEGSQLPNAEMC